MFVHVNQGSDSSELERERERERERKEERRLYVKGGPNEREGRRKRAVGIVIQYY